MAERSVWNGSLSFGLVSIPVSLHTATESKSIAFNQIHAKCKTKIQEKRWCPTCQREVAWDEIEKGYQYAKGKYIALSGEDLEALPLPSKQTIAVQAFVKLKEIDPIYFEKSYYLQPDEKVERPFALFIHTLMEKKVVAIGTFAIRSKERLCCLRPAGGNLILDTLFYPEEIKVDFNQELPQIKLSGQEIKMASSLVDMMMQPFDLTQFKDHYREAMQKLIDAKLKGVPLTSDENPSKGAKLYDLMDALRRSVAKQKTTSKPKSTGAKAIKEKSIKKSHLRSLARTESKNTPAKRKVSR